MPSRDQIVRDRQQEGIAHLLGETINRLRAEPDVTDIIVNPPLDGEKDCRIWVARLGHDREPVGLMPVDQARRLVGAVAVYMGRDATDDTPNVEGVLPDGSRFQGCIEPIVSGAFIAIRLRASAVFPLSQYVAEGKMTAAQKAAIEGAIRDRLNILIVGGTGSGKTTLLNGVILAMTEIHPHHRFFVIEDTRELRCPAPDRTMACTSAAMSIRALVRVAMLSIGVQKGPL
jgi:type IV secretion system protein VirB11